MIVAGVPLPDPLLMACRAVVAPTGQGAVTRLPEVFVARYHGDSAHAARTYFATLWRLVRPHVAGREAVMPRIFAT
jgi:urease accessory protein